ncbi:geranylgeranyl transferase type-1 subunit beta-like [Telopea speciosissima]|uniref:geranylgeranyl transferase type-1 subunit beta-like n=1 Tax=Telopea speciosissima TaxID=54955 RepID=UPI001CC66094|nr:geranylgeranyl transferase type-1 subunit beta-like [Telopea speciosissima]
MEDSEWSPYCYSSSFDKDIHIRFFQMMCETLPSDYQGQEINRLTLAYFAISGLDILGALDRVLKMLFLVSVYFLILNNFFSSVFGSFMPIHIGAETDLRFVYCAAAICFMLKNWSGMDREKAKDYILNCQSYDGGFGLVPGSESHGGATYCAVAALKLMGFIEDDLISKSTPSSIINVPLLLEWSLQRQTVDGGIQGRPNKASDTCYAFWVGGVLRILGAHKFLDSGALHGFLLTCQSQYGGCSKFPGKLPDLYHSYYGLSAFNLLEESGLKPLCIDLGISDVVAFGM